MDHAHVLLTDSLGRPATPEPHILPVERMVDLGAVLAGAEVGRTGRDDITAFCSVGLAGTEVAVAAVLLEESH
ncbi:hypothetical protein [Streptomyces sp. LS1784]|uniref:hypothetical protein n=1 Tax=Streptomyces sp. LS1784 TaxID=2851533 RepID=UPI001CCF9F85|nr:hypothetical protein [Streptomyces sp. LS1784]